MKISEQARRSAIEAKRFPSEAPQIIQAGIDDHERDLVEAAEKYLKSNSLSDRLELKAALDRRKETETRDDFTDPDGNLDFGGKDGEGW